MLPPANLHKVQSLSGSRAFVDGELELGRGGHDRHFAGVTNGEPHRGPPKERHAPHVSLRDTLAALIFSYHGILTMSTSAHIPSSIAPATAGLSGGAVRTLRKLHNAKHKQQQAVLSEETRRTFEFISDPKNAELFSVKAGLKAFSRVKV